MSHTIRRTYDLFIGNEWRGAASAETLASISPLSGEVLTTVPDAGPADIEAAVQAAEAALPRWSDAPARKRQEALDQAADLLLADARRIAWLETADTGKPWRESLANVHTAAERLRYYAGAVRAFEGRITPVSGDITSYDHRTPLGVVGVIGAWNFPLNMFVGKIAPAIAAGNAVVYKPADPTPITTLEIAEIFARALPPGVVNVVTGRGPTAGAAILQHPRIRKVSLTGAVATGRKAMELAAPTGKRLTLELGGKNAQIVYPDADLEKAAQNILLGAFMNQGQVCTSGSRLFVHADVADALRDRLLGLIPKLRIGDPFDEGVTMGTLATRAHYDRVVGFIEGAQRDGARLLCGGGPVQVAAWPKGLFLAPTLFDRVPDGARIAREEVFGPVATIHEWRDEAAMFAAVNGLEYGLAAGVWTADLGRAHRAARRVQAGRVWVNCYNLFPSGASFGGSKGSGYGREDAFETLLDFTEVKNVIIDASASWRRFYD